MASDCWPRCDANKLVMDLICLTRAVWMAGPRVPAACQPGLKRGVRGVSPRLKKRIEEALLPHSKGGPPLPEGRTPLTRKADPPYPKGGPPLPERRAFLTRKAGTTYSQGGYSLLERRMYSLLERPSSRGGYSLLARRILLTRKADTPYSEVTRKADTPYSRGGY